MFSNPARVIEQLGLSDGQIVADFGAGAGFYAVEAARKVAPSGKVYAVDVQRELLERLKRDAEGLRVRNVDAVTGNLERLGGSRLKDASCDVVISSNVLFMLDDRKAFLLEAKRVLRGKGRLLLVDWSASFGNMGPHPDHVVYKDEAMRLAHEAGFAYDREIDAGAHHYGIIFRKN